MAGGLVKSYTSTLQKWRYVALGTAVVLLVVTTALGPRLLSSTSNAYLPPDNTRAAHADRKLKQVFPRFAQTASLGVYIEATSDHPHITNDTGLHAFQTAVNASARLWRDDPGFVLSLSGYYLAIDDHVSPAVAAKAFVAPDGKSTLMAITIAAAITDEDSASYADFFRAEMHKAVHLAPGYTFTLTGVPAFMKSVEAAVSDDLELMDSIALPLTFLVLAYVLESLRLLIIPLLCIGMSAMLSFTLVWAVSTKMVILSFVPSFMMSLLIALSVDYGLFCMHRYREALLAGESQTGAVNTMLKSAGHTILVSGSTLAFCFLGLALFNLEMLRAVGVGCSLSIVAILAINLTMPPLMLLTFPNFFARCAQPSPYWPPSQWCKSRGDASDGKPAATTGGGGARRMSSSSSTGSSGDHGHGRRHSDAGEAAEEEEIDQSANASAITSLLPKSAARSVAKRSAPGEVASLSKSCWWRLSSYMLRFPYNLIVIVVILAATMPFNMQALNVSRSDSMSMVMPRGAASTEALNKMTEAYSYGAVFPFSILIVPPKGTDVMGTGFVSNINATVSAMVTAPEMKGLLEEEDFESVVYNPLLQELFFGDIAAFAAKTKECVESPSEVTFPCPFVHMLADQTLNTAKTAVIVNLMTRFDPLALTGKSFIKHLRSVMDREAKRTGYEYSVTGVPADSMDAIASVYDAAPVMCGITIGVMLLFVSVAFKSVLVPIRSVVTITLTLAFVYGVAVYAYQHGMLNWTHIPGLKETATGSQFWLTPIMCFPIITGISLDYDVFLLVRIREYRAAGYSTLMAIRMGLTKTGRIITAAGVSMAVAFGGLLLSTTPMMNMLSLYLTVAVLFDTFVIRTMLVPTLMVMLGEANWWPGKVPRPFVTEEEEVERAVGGGRRHNNSNNNNDTKHPGGVLADGGGGGGDGDAAAGRGDVESGGVYGALGDGGAQEQPMTAVVASSPDRR